MNFLILYVNDYVTRLIDVKAHDVTFLDFMQILVENKRNLLLHIPYVFGLLRRK